jgi:hypothetical protein
MIDFAGVPELDHSDSPYYQAFRRMKDNTPSCSSSLKESLQREFWEVRRPTGFLDFKWHGAIGGRFGIRNWMAIPNDVDLNDIGYAGVYMGRTASKTHILYCIVPSMKHGESVAGETVDFGHERVRIGWRQEDVDGMVMQAYEIMMRMIAERGEYRESVE